MEKSKIWLYPHGREHLWRGKIRYIESLSSMRDRASDIGYQLLVSPDKVKRNKFGLYSLIGVYIKENCPPEIKWIKKEKEKEAYSISFYDPKDLEISK